MRCVPHTPDVDNGVVRVSPATGERGRWYLWRDESPEDGPDAVEDRQQLAPRIKTDTLVNLEDVR